MDEELKETTAETSKDSGPKNSDSDKNSVDLSQFLTIDIAIEEIRLRCQESEGRRKSVQSKISTIVTINALIIAAFSMVSTATGSSLFLTVVPSLLSTLIGLWGLRTCAYSRPGSGEFADYYDYAKKPRKDHHDFWLRNYYSALSDNIETIEQLYSFYNVCFLLTTISLLSMLQLTVLKIASSYFRLVLNFVL